MDNGLVLGDKDELLETLSREEDKESVPEEWASRPALDELDYVMEAWQERVDRENRRAQRNRDEIMRQHLLAIAADLERLVDRSMERDLGRIPGRLISKDLGRIQDRIKRMLNLVEPLEPLSPLLVKVEEDSPFFFFS